MTDDAQHHLDSRVQDPAKLLEHTTHTTWTFNLRVTSSAMAPLYVSDLLVPLAIEIKNEHGDDVFVDLSYDEQTKSSWHDINPF